MESIKKLAIDFQSLGGMAVDSDKAIDAHVALADAIESSSEYADALAIVQSIVVNFDY